MTDNEMYSGEAYCVRCKVAKNFIGQVTTSEFGRKMATGRCPDCGTTMRRLLVKT